MVLGFAAILVTTKGKQRKTERSAIMANQMHNDGELATQILVWSTLFSSITMFILIAALRFVGIF